jgi:hypothetical protein
MLTYKRLNKINISKYVELLSICFPGTKIFNYEYLEWLYFKNPNGNAIGFDAFDKDILVAHYSLIPKKIKLHGQTHKCLLSLNTATHPRYQKKGLFLDLAKLSIKEAVKLNYSSIYGVANKNSLRGFEKLGFNFIKRLDIIITFNNIKACFTNKKLDFLPIWDELSLRWRVSNPNKKIYITKGEYNPTLSTPFIKKIVNIITPENLEKDNLNYSFIDYLNPSIFNVHIGLFPKNIIFNKVLNFNLPLIFRKAPLNFIYLNLKGKNNINKDNIYFTFIDFDAY